MSKFRYLLKEGFRNIWANRLMSIASIGVLFSCLLLIGVAVILSFNIDKGLGEIEKDNIIMVFLDDVSESRAKEIEADIKDMDTVAKCEFVSKDEALESQMDAFDSDSKSYFEALKEDNPLPDSFRVSAKSAKVLPRTVENLKQIDGVIGVNSSKKLTDALITVRKVITIAGLVMIGILFIISLFIISNTIKITMYSRKLEIGIMKAVGATDKFVRTPFVIEGMILGVISGLLSTGLLYYLYKVATVYLQKRMPANFEFVAFSEFALYFLVGFITIGVLAGVFGSVISIGKYLRHEGSEFNAF